MKKPKRVSVTVTLKMRFSLLEAKNQPGRVSFHVGAWWWHGVTPKQAEKILKNHLKTLKVDDP